MSPDAGYDPLFHQPVHGLGGGVSTDTGKLCEVTYRGVQVLTRLRTALQDWEPPLDEGGNIVVKYPQEDEQNSDGIEIIDLGSDDPDDQVQRAMQIIKDVFGLENENPN